MALSKKLKQQSNRNKIELGIILLELQKLYKECEVQGIDDFGTFDSALAELHLNKRRSLKMLRNSAFILEEQEIDFDLWDSSVIELIRRNKKHLQDYRDDIQAGVSYSDLEKIIS